MVICKQYLLSLYINVFIAITFIYSHPFCTSSAYVLHRNPTLSIKCINNNDKFNLSANGDKIGLIIDTLKTLNLLEASELVKRIEDTFGIDSTAYITAASPAVSKQETAEDDSNEEDDLAMKGEPPQSEFTITLVKIVDDKRMQMLRIIKEINPALNLKEAKETMDNLPYVMAEKLKKEAMEALKARIEEAGGTVEIS